MTPYLPIRTGRVEKTTDSASPPVCTVCAGGCGLYWSVILGGGPAKLCETHEREGAPAF